MDDSEQRQIMRDSLFVMADMRLEDSDVLNRIKVRNLSSGGMMGEGEVRVHRGTVVWIDIRNIGWVEGSVAWVQDTRFGVAFREEIDPRIARAQVGQSHETPQHISERTRNAPGGSLRKI